MRDESTEVGGTGRARDNLATSIDRKLRGVLQNIETREPPPSSAPVCSEHQQEKLRTLEDRYRNMYPLREGVEESLYRIAFVPPSVADTLYNLLTAVNKHTKNGFTPEMKTCSKDEEGNFIENKHDLREITASIADIRQLAKDRGVESDTEQEVG